MGIIHQDFVIQKSYFNSLYDFYFPKRKTSLIIVTNTALHFNDHDLSRPDECPLLANFLYRWQTSRNVGKFHTKTDYSKGTNQEKDSNKQIGIFIFKTQKSKTKALRPYVFVGRRIILLRFSHKEQSSDKVYRFSDK